MPDSAERPLIGKDLDNDRAPYDADGLVSAHHEEPPIRPLSRDMSFSFRIEPPCDDDLQDADGPVIRRVGNSSPAGPARRGLCTPRLFSQQFDDELPPPEPSPTSVPAMQESLLGDFGESGNQHFSRHSDVNFSVAAIRAKRMKQPAGTYTPTSIATKIFVAAIVGVFCVTSGVTLGLYGSELGYQAKRQAQIATASIAGTLPSWGGNATRPDSAGESLIATNPDAGAPSLSAGLGNQTTAPPAGGKKLFYDRILPTTAQNSASLEGTAARAATVTPAATVAPARLTGLEAHLAVPSNLFAPVTASE
jgi:hypothetical protein